jgi:hypothetical protein
VKQAPPARLRDKAAELHQTSIRRSELCQTNIMFSLGGANLCAFELVDLAPKRIWADEWYERQRRLMAAVDHLNGKFGQGAMKCGLFHSYGLCRTRFAKGSPRYIHDAMAGDMKGVRSFV